MQLVSLRFRMKEFFSQGSDAGYVMPSLLGLIAWRMAHNCHFIMVLERSSILLEQVVCLLLALLKSILGVLSGVTDVWICQSA